MPLFLSGCLLGDICPNIARKSKSKAKAKAKAKAELAAKTMTKISASGDRYGFRRRGKKHNQ